MAKKQTKTPSYDDQFNEALAEARVMAKASGQASTKKLTWDEQLDDALAEARIIAQQQAQKDQIR